jgi:hypothetical protein
MSAAATNGVILERLDQLRCDVNGLSGELRALADNVQKFELMYTAEHVKVVERLDAAHRRIDDHDKKFVEIDATVKGMQLSVIDMTSQVRQMKAILVWIGGSVGVFVIALLWQIFTHQVAVVFP